MIGLCYCGCYFCRPSYKVRTNYISKLCGISRIKDTVCGTNRSILLQIMQFSEEICYRAFPPVLSLDLETISEALHDVSKAK